MMCTVNYAAFVKLIMPWLLFVAARVAHCMSILYRYIVHTYRCSIIISGVCILTVRRNCVYMLLHGQTQDAGSQNRSTAATRLPESASGEGDRSALLGIGFFRRPRSGSSQVRDGPPSRKRWANRQRQRRGFRAFRAPLFTRRKAYWNPAAWPHWFPRSPDRGAHTS
jgi:hypothetical protein